MATALARRITQIQSSEDELDDELADGEEDAPPPPQVPLTADELRRLIFSKYNKSHDMSIVRRDIPGKTFVCLNIMWNHLEQRSFKMTEEQVRGLVE